MRLQLHALAYNLANFLRSLALPREVEQWSLTTLREKLVKEREKAKQRAAEQADIAAVTNAPELLGVAERELQSALHSGEAYLRTASNQSVYIADILENYRRLRGLLETLTARELWPCVVTHSEDAQLFSAPLDVPPTLAAMLVAELRKVSTDELPFPSAPAFPVQVAVSKEAAAQSEGLRRAQPYFVEETQKLVGLPAENAEAGFVRGATLDTELRGPRSLRRKNRRGREWQWRR